MPGPRGRGKLALAGQGEPSADPPFTQVLRRTGMPEQPGQSAGLKAQADAFSNALMRRERVAFGACVRCIETQNAARQQKTPAKAGV